MCNGEADTPCLLYPALADSRLQRLGAIHPDQTIGRDDYVMFALAADFRAQPSLLGYSPAGGRGNNYDDEEPLIRRKGLVCSQFASRRTNNNAERPEPLQHKLDTDHH